MMTSSLGSTIAKTTFCISLMLGIPISVNALSAPANYVQQQQYPETPDPYFKPKFNAKSVAIRKPVNKPILMPMEPDTNQAPSPLWSAPQTNVPKSSKPTPSPKPDVVWDAPRTDVSSAELKPLIRKSTPSTMEFSPLKVPDENQHALNPITRNSTRNGSIIREKESDSGNEFNPSAFGSTSQQSAPRTPLLSPQRKTSPLDLAASPKSSQGFSTDNSFMAQSIPAAPNRALKSDPADSLKSFAPKETLRPQTSNVKPSPSKSDSPLSGMSAKSETSKAAEDQSFEPGKILALVGGEPIFVGDLLFEINQMIEKFMPTAPASVKELERQKMIPQILPKFVESKILFLGTLQLLPEEADIEQVLEQASKEFDDKALDKMIKGSGLKTASEFDANLRAMGSSLRQLRRSWAQDQLTKYFLSQQLKATEEVTHQDMLDSYRENIETYAIPAKCRWEQLNIRFDRSDSRETAKQTIAKLRKEVIYGANFAAVAKNNSHGFMASTGGQHDWTTKGALVLKEIDEAIFSLPIAEISDIIESPDGYHVIRVIERTDATRKPFLEAQVEIKKRIETENRQKSFDQHVAKLKRQIPVEYFVNDEAKATVAAGTPQTVNR